MAEYRVGHSGGALPYKTWLSTLSPTPCSPPPLRMTELDLAQAKRLLSQECLHTRRKDEVRSVCGMFLSKSSLPFPCTPYTIETLI